MQATSTNTTPSPPLRGQKEGTNRTLSQKLRGNRNHVLQGVVLGTGIKHLLLQIVKLRYRPLASSSGRQVFYTY